MNKLRQERLSEKLVGGLLMEGSKVEQFSVGSLAWSGVIILPV